MESFYAVSTTPPSNAMELLQGPSLPRDYIYMSASHSCAPSSRTENAEQDLPTPCSLERPHSLSTLNIHARTFAPGACEHGHEAGLNAHATEFVPGSQINNTCTGQSSTDGLGAAFLSINQQYPRSSSSSDIFYTGTMPSTSETLQHLSSAPLHAGVQVFSPCVHSREPYVFEAQLDFDAEALYHQRMVEEMEEDNAYASQLHVQGFYFPTSSNGDDYIPPVFAAFRDFERFPPSKVESEEQAPECHESSRRSFVQYMHDGDKRVEDEDEEGHTYRVIADPQTDYQWFELDELQALKCVHHFNVFGRPVLTKSGTSPATTIAILKSTPKHLNVTTPNGLWKSTVMECAQQLLDPVRYYGRRETLESLHGSELENACIGQCEKTYSQHGWWVHDYYSPDEDRVVADPLDPWYYSGPTEAIMINGINKGFAHRVDIISAATREKEAEDAARKAAFNARLAQGRKPSRLGLSCFTRDDVEERPAFIPHRWTPSFSLHHKAQSPVRQPATIPVPAQEAAGPSSEVVVPDRYTTGGGSLSREEWQRRLAATEDRPVAACWADDEDEDEDEEEGDEGEENVIPTVPSSVGAPDVPPRAVVCEDENAQSGNHKPATDQEVEDTESVHNNEDRRVSSSSASTTVESTGASSVSPRGTPDTSPPASDNEDAESKAATDNESDSISDGAESAVDNHQHSQNEDLEVSEFDGTDNISSGEEISATYSRALDADTDTDDETEEEHPMSTAVTLASSLHARLDALEIAMQTAATSSTPHIPSGPVTPPRAARRIPSLPSSVSLSPTSTLVATPESSAPTFVDSPSIPTPTPRYRGLNARSNPPVVVFTPNGPLPSGLRPVVHRFPNGAITMTLPGQPLGLVRSRGMRFDRLPADFGNAHIQRASVPPTRILSREGRPTFRTENVPGFNAEAARHVAEHARQVGTALTQSQLPTSRALVPYRGRVRLDNPMQRYFQAWNRLLAIARSSGEYFWQCVLGRNCVERYLDAHAFERATAIHEEEEEEGVEQDITSVRTMSPVVNRGHDTEEGNIGNMTQPNEMQTQVAEYSIGVTSAMSPEATTQNESESSSPQAATLLPLTTSIGSLPASRLRHEGRRVRFALPPSPSPSITTANSHPSPLRTIHHFQDDVKTNPPPSANVRWPESNSVQCTSGPLPPSTLPLSSRWSSTSEVSRFSWTSSNDSLEAESREQSDRGEEGGVDGEYQRLYPIPRLPAFQRTREGWRHASWKATERKRLTKRRRPPAPDAQVSSTRTDLGGLSTATTTAAQSTGVEVPQSSCASTGVPTSAFGKANAKTKKLWKKTVQKIKAMCTKKR